MSIFLAIVLLIKRDALVGTIFEINSLMPSITPALVAAIVLIFTSSMNTATASLISVEGKTLWIIRSMPVRARDALLAKVHMHLLIGGIPVIIASIIAAIALAGSIVDVIIITIAPLSMVLLIAYFGLMLNLQHPRFDWINIVQPIKQGMPVMITMFGGMGVIVALGLIYGFLLRKLLSVNVFLLCAIVGVLAVTWLLHRWLVTRGANRWDSLDA
jgi:ABC-2 type transport system permease protein